MVIFFIERIVYLVEDCEKIVLDYIRVEERRNDVMTEAKVQPFCVTSNFNIV